MENTPEVTVGGSDGLGLRKVLIDGRPVGSVRSRRELRGLLRRAGLPPDQPVRWFGADDTVWPDRAWRRRAIGSFMVLGLLVTAYPLFRIGLSDSGDALTYGGRIAGFTVLVAALMELAAAAAAVDYWRRRRWSYSGVTVLAGVVLSLVCSILFLSLQIGECFTGYTLIGMALAAWSSVALFRLIRCRAWQGLHVPRRIAIGVIVSTLLAVTNLAYTQLYVPYVMPPVLQSGAEFRDSVLARGGKRMYVTVHLHVKNAYQVPVYVLDSIYWIHGGSASSFSDGKAARDDLIYDGAFVTPVGRVLNPGEEVLQDAVVEINDPQARNYEAIKAQTEVYVIRKDRMTMPADYERSKAVGARISREAGGGDPPMPSTGIGLTSRTVVKSST